jgi:hypothetical protein
MVAGADGGSERFVHDRMNPVGRLPRAALCAGHECVAETRARVEDASPATRPYDQTTPPQYGQVVGDVSGRASEERRKAGRVRGLVERAQDLGACHSDQVRK